ncbi:Alpha/Beta hydrolase fold [Amanita muscaria]
MVRGSANSPRQAWLRKLNQFLKRFTPWQIIVSTLTAVYALRNLDKILGLNAPEPLARLYSPSFYRATWIITGLDAGFATAMSIRPKWLRDICSIIFSVYYIIHANYADEKLRRFRAVPTVEMLRATWEKTSHPFLRLISHLPSISSKRKIFIPRPKCSSYTRPVTAYLFFDLPEDQLCNATELILDFPGGGFVAMSPEHHEERLRTWAKVTRRPVLSVDYGKAPEYPYPFAIDEAFDTYKTLVESVGRCIGMSGKSLHVIMSGDSAGATLTVNTVNRILELRNRPGPTRLEANLPLPVALVLNYAALDFNFTSWMSDENLRVLRSEQSTGNLPGLAELVMQKDHLQHVSPLSMVRDRPRPSHLQRRKSWKDTFRALTSSVEQNTEEEATNPPPLRSRQSTGFLRASNSLNKRRQHGTPSEHPEDNGSLADSESEEDFRQCKVEERPIGARVLYSYDRLPSPPGPAKEIPEMERDESHGQVPSGKTDAVSGKAKGAIGTRLTMTSRTGYFQDRIISPSMMRAMAIMYIGPHRNPDFKTDYHISPILTPSNLLAQYPPLLMQCGERDPFVDDTVIFAGRIREAKRARKIELELMISGRSARFGEGLRMTRNEDNLDPKILAALKKEQDRLANESEEDWVRIDLFSDWSHGYLQMGTLMRDAKEVIEELGEWIDDAFSRFPSPITGNGHNMERNYLTVMQSHAGSQGPSPLASETEADEPGITFIAKKYMDDSRRDSFDIPSRSRRTVTPEGTRSSSGSDRTILEENVEASKGAKKGETAQEQGLLLEGQKPATPRQAGQTISETELMRRRRLLDSHIFEKEQ